jgi:surface polysaccharide O-acyltransferase-like enzyme
MNRELNMDMARLVACAAVVLLHTTGRTIYAFETTGDLSYGAAIILNSAVRWCVPVFVMLSGGLLLARPIADPGAFLWRRAQTIIIPLVVWSAAYLWWRVTYYEEPFSWAWAGREVLSGMPYYHLYFLF